MTRFLVFAILLCLSSHQARASVAMEANAFYFSDNFTSATTSTYNRTIWDADLALSLSHKGQIMLGWDYNSATFGDVANSTTTQLTVTGMGPKLIYYLDKDLTWDLMFTYDLVLNGTENVTGTSAVQLQGSAMKGELGYTPMIAESLHLGIKLNYYKASFNKEITNSTTITAVSWSRTAIYPSVALIYHWE